MIAMVEEAFAEAAPGVTSPAPPAYDAIFIVLDKKVESIDPPAYQLAEHLPIANRELPDRSITISTAGRELSSSFPYHPSLFNFDICPLKWYRFTTELINAAAPTTGQKALAVLSGIGTACVVGSPWPSIYVGRWVLRRQVVENVKRGLKDDAEGLQEEREGVGAILNRWNAAWADKGLVVRLRVVEKGLYMKGTVKNEELEGERKRRGEGKKCCGRRWKCDGKAEGHHLESSAACGGLRRCCGEKMHCSKKNRGCCGKAKRHFMVVIEKVNAQAADNTLDKKKPVTSSETVA